MELFRTGVSRKGGGIDPKRGFDRDAVEDVAQRIIREIADLAAAVRVAVVEGGARAVGFDEGKICFARGGDDRQTGSRMLFCWLRGAQGNNGREESSLTVRHIVSPMYRMLCFRR